MSGAATQETVKAPGTTGTAAGLTRSAPLLMVLATLLFAAMGLCVKLAAAQQYTAGEIVLYRGLIGAVLIGLIAKLRGGTLKTPVPQAHFWRSLTGVCSLMLWFQAIGALPIATAMTLNYMSSVWMVLFLLGAASFTGNARTDPRLVATVLAGFLGVGCVLRPTLGSDQLWSGVLGLLSGMLSAFGYMQVSALARLREPDYRTVFYFCIGGVVAGAASTVFTGGLHAHTPEGLMLLAGVGVFASLAQLLLTRAYAVGRVLVNASLQYLGIAWAFVIGVLVFDDKVTALALAGMVLIVGAGIAAARLRNAAPPADIPGQPGRPGRRASDRVAAPKAEME